MGFDFQRQNSRNPLRCQRMKVSGLTTISDIRQSNSRLTVTISHLVASSARCGLTFLSSKSASCFRRNRFSARQGPAGIANQTAGTFRHKFDADSIYLKIAKGPKAHNDSPRACR